MRRWFLLLPLIATACSARPDRAAFLNTLVGRNEAEVVRALGVPSRTYETQGHTFLAYTEQRADIISGGPFLFGGGFYGGGFGPGFGYAATFPTEVVPRVCETTFDVEGGRVLTWSLRGNACG